MTTTLAISTELPGHAEAMGLAITEYDRFIELISGLAPGDWSRPTDCTLWDVKAMVAHNLANMESAASMREMAHQMRTAIKRAKASGNPMVDECTALQIDERAHLSPEELVQRVTLVKPRAIRGRRGMPAPIRKAMRFSAPEPFGKITLGYFSDTVVTRDMWMHRVDICRATGAEMVMTSEHDGRIVAAVVGDWSRSHGQPFNLVLSGVAGGTFERGEGGDRSDLDAVTFCRIVSGREPALANGLLATEVLY